MDSLTQIVKNPLFSSFSTGIVGLALIGLLWWRAGSIHSILDRVWRLIAGKAEVQNSTLKSFLQANRDLEKFRFIYRLKVETIADLNKLIEWMGRHSLSISALQKIRRWVDVRSAEIVMQPPKNYIKAKIIVIGMVSMVFFGGNFLETSRSTLFQMKQSKIWFKTDAMTIEAPFGGWSFSSSDCEGNVASVMRETGFLAHEAVEICRAMKGDSLKALVRQDLKIQRSVGAFGTIAAFLIILYCIFSVVSAQEATRLRKKLYGDSAVGTVSAVDEGG
ncbi:DUF6216 family protein [Burkholderia ubonensis]|uniref:DUF6216 family protein n=1 Tax=Burkholderia ubonensis TaxID=101571 RepID=UPI0011607443|nr:DUF6216 family protein [Burkholderia ubonensis]